MDNLMKCGLLSVADNKPVPLKGVEVRADVKGYVSNITSVFSYHNDSQDNIEAVFTFPVDDNSAVYQFEAVVNGKTIKAEVQEKSQAKETYDDAIKSGRTATLLEESDSSGDIFRCKIGNFGPKSDATITIAMVTEMPLTSDGFVTFTLPTVLCPRYNPGGEQDGGVAKPDKVKYVAASAVPYSFTFTASVESNGRIKEISSRKDKITHTFSDTAENKAEVTLAEPFKPNHDLSFDVKYSDANEAKAFLEKGQKDKGGILMRDVAMLNFFPELSSESYSNAQEFIFVIDRSGSMGGGRIEAAKETLLLLLKSLPVGCYFNIISFGSNFEALFPQGSKKYDGESLATAMQLQKSMSANFGGTEILAPLRDIYSKPVKTTHARQIFLLTDGQVYNTDMVIRQVEKHSRDTRVFTFGIGDGVSTSLINGIARAGRGTAEFIKDSDRLQAKVMKSMKAATQASVTSLEMTWSPDIKFTQIPQDIPTVFAGDRLIMYALCPEEADLSNVRVTLTGKVGDKRFESKTEFVGGSKEVSNTSFYLHRLAAKAQITQLETQDSDKHKDKIILLSTSANVVSKHTSMVGVDNETKKTLGPMIHREIPMPEEEFAFAASAGPPRARQRMMMCASPMACDSSEFATSAGPSLKLKKKAVEKDIGYVAASAMEIRDDYMDEVAEMRDVVLSGDYMSVVKLQEFTGSWKLDAALCNQLSLSKEKITQAAPVKDLDVWVTVLALQYLESRFGDRQDEWEMVAIKARQWLQSQADKMGGKSFEDLAKQAKALF